MGLSLFTGPNFLGFSFTRFKVLVLPSLPPTPQVCCQFSTGRRTPTHRAQSHSVLPAAGTLFPNLLGYSLAGRAPIAQAGCSARCGGRQEQMGLAQEGQSFLLCVR